MKTRIIRSLWLLAVFVCAINFCSCRNPKSQKLFSFAVVADIQYADKETEGKRFYRKSLSNLERCVDDLNSRDLLFTIQLGDIIDGSESRQRTKTDLEKVLSVFNRLNMPKIHVVGNHCLVAGRELISQELGLEKFYYDFYFPEAEDWRFIVLDGNDAGYGILSDTQLTWLNLKLFDSREKGERIIIFCHYPALEAAALNHRLDEPGPLLEVMDKYDSVVAYITGHDHAGGYALRHDVHHITMHGMVEAPYKNAYAVIEVYPEMLKLIGYGVQPSRELAIPKRR